MRDAPTAGGSSPDPLAMSGPFRLVGKDAARGYPPTTRTNEGGFVQSEVAQIEKKLGSGKQKAPKLTDRLQKVCLCSAAPFLTLLRK